MNGSRIAGILGTVVLAGIGWLYAAPAALGGQVRAYSITGASMEPSFQAGDLVLVRPRSSYAPGDIVAYRSATVGAVLLHRIVSLDEGVATLRGDANATDDLDRPRADELIGALVLRIPSGGRIVRTAASPMLLVVLAAATLASTYGRRRGKHRRPVLPLRHPVLADGARMRAAGTGVAVAAGICVLVASSLAFGGRTTASSTMEHEQRGAFSYKAFLPRSIYPDGVARTGDAVFVSATDSLRVAFTYGLSSEAAHRIEGMIGLRANIDDGHGWSRALTLVRPTPFSGDAARVDGILDLARIARLRGRLEAVTGVQRIVYRIDLQATVDVHGSLGAAPLDTVFTASLPLEHDGSVIRYIRSSDPTTDPLRPTQAGSVAGPVVALERSIRFAGWSVPADVAASALVLLASLLVAASRGLYRASANTSCRSDAERLRTTFSSRIVKVEAMSDANAIMVPTLDDFTRLVASGTDPVFECEVPGGTAWLFDHGSSRYAFRDGAPILEVAEMDARSPMAAVGIA